MKAPLILITLLLAAFTCSGQQVEKPDDRPCPEGYIRIQVDKWHWKCVEERLPVSLPVTLVYFRAGSANGETVLYWSTATESSNSHYEVQGSADAQSFATIGTVYPESPNSSEVRYYRFKPQPYQYYRLVQVDQDGTRNASHIITGPAVRTEKQIIYNSIGQRL